MLKTSQSGSVVPCCALVQILAGHGCWQWDTTSIIFSNRAVIRSSRRLAWCIIVFEWVSSRSVSSGDRRHSKSVHEHGTLACFDCVSWVFWLGLRLLRPLRPLRPLRAERSHFSTFYDWEGTTKCWLCASPTSSMDSVSNSSFLSTESHYGLFLKRVPRKRCSLEMD